jgi:hypothetical protein
MTNRIRGLALATLVLVLAWPAPAPAIDLSGTGVLTSAGFRPEIGDEVVVFAVNTGSMPLRVELQMVRADDLTVIATSGSLNVAPGSGVQHVFIPDDFPVLLVARYRVQGTTGARFSVQVVDPAGETRIFTDGFESGG